MAVIVTWDAPASLAAKAATKTTPIVFLTGTDPVEIGLVESFSRPSGNLTGIYNLITGLGPKHLELLHELLPTAGTIVSLLNPDNPNARAYALRTQAAADALGLRLQVLTAHTEADLEAAFGIMVQQRADALAVIADPLSAISADCTTSIGTRHNGRHFCPFHLIVWQALGATMGSKWRCRRPPKRHVLPEDHPLVGAVDLFDDGAALVRQSLCVRRGHFHPLRYPFLI